MLDLTPFASPAAPALTDTASPLVSTAPDLTRTASPLDSTAPGLTRTASPLDSTAPDLTRTASPLDPKALDLTPAVSPLDPAVLDPARTPVLILADPPDAPDLVARLLELAREKARQPQPRWWSVMKAGRSAVGQQAGPAVGQAGRPSRPRPVQRLIFMHPRDPAPPLPACEPDDPLQIETFAIEDRAARALFRRWPPHLGLDPVFDQVPHLLFLGFAPPARALLLQALLLAHYGQGRPRITLVCDRHEAVATEFLAAYPQASSIADLRFAPLEELSSLLRPADATDLNSPVSLQPPLPNPPPPGGREQENRNPSHAAWVTESLPSPPMADPPVTLAVVCIKDAPRPHRNPDSAAQTPASLAPSPPAGEGWGEGAEGLPSPPMADPPVTLAVVCLEHDPRLPRDPAAQTPASLAPSPLAGEGWGEGAEGLHTSAPHDRPPADATDPPGLALARRLIQELAASQGVSPPVLLEVGTAEPGADIEDWDGQIIPISYRHEACRAALLLDGAGDELARNIHEHYRDTIAAQGRDLTQEPAGQPWERLATSYRQANRHQADHVWAKLAVTDCRAVAEDLVEAFALTPLEVERLAIVEHARWAADRYLDGWAYGPVRDNARKLHPQLIPYADLSEAMKDLDRFAVRGLPTLAARLGLGIQRLLILGIHPPGSACPSGKPLRHLATALGERLRERYPDRALVIAATLADQRERDLVRELMEGAWGASLFLLLPQPLSHRLARLTPTAARRDFLTLLAQAERRISLRGEGELAAWFTRRAEIQLILSETLPASVAGLAMTALVGVGTGDFSEPRLLARTAGSAPDTHGPGTATVTETPGQAPAKRSSDLELMKNLAGVPDKFILLKADGDGLTWTFDY